MRCFFLIAFITSLLACSDSGVTSCQKVLHDHSIKFDRGTLNVIPVSNMDYEGVVFDREYYGPKLIQKTARQGSLLLVSEEIDSDDFFITSKYYSYSEHVRNQEIYLERKYGEDFKGEIDFDVVWKNIFDGEELTCETLYLGNLGLYSFFTERSLFFRAFKNSDYYLSSEGKAALIDSNANNSIVVLEDGSKAGFHVLTIYSKNDDLLFELTYQYVK